MDVFLNSESRRKFKHVTIGTEISARVKFGAVYVSFEKNNVAF